MKIALVIHSNSENTLSVAEKIKLKLLAQGHEAVIEKVSASNNQEIELNKVELTNNPDLQGYDACVFGAPVHAFSLSGVMRFYLGQIKDFEAKPVFCFVTQHFPFRCLGGNHALRQFEKALNNKNALIKGTSVVNWSSKKRVDLIDKTVELISF